MEQETDESCGRRRMMKDKGLIDGETLLSCIDLFNTEDNKSRKEWLETNSNNPESKSNTIFTALCEVLKERNSEADAMWFIVSLSRLRSAGTFYNEAEMNEVKDGLIRFNIQPPEYVKNCIQEFQARTSFINRLLNEATYDWTDDKVNDFNRSLNDDIRLYSTGDVEGDRNRITTLFEQSVNRTMQIEKGFEAEYVYQISSMFDGGAFVMDKGELNEFFYHNESHKGSINAFFDLTSKIREYFDERNRLKILKARLRQLTEGEKATPQKNGGLSVLQWATVFYYASGASLLPRSALIKESMQYFLDKHEVDTTFDTFKNKYSIAKNRLIKTNDYPIKKLESIMPFLAENYPQVVPVVNNEIDFLKREDTD